MSNSIHMQKPNAFSLLELMVVIGIISLLATISIPYYAEYTNKSKVAAAALVLNDLNVKTMALYNQGLVTPGITSLTVGGYEFEDQTPLAYDSPPVIGATFYAPDDGVVSSNAWMFCAYVGRLNFDGYVESIGGDYSRLCSKVIANNGIFTTYCGRYSTPNTTDIPEIYLPEQCNETNIASF